MSTWTPVSLTYKHGCVAFLGTCLYVPGAFLSIPFNGIINVIFIDVYIVCVKNYSTKSWISSDRMIVIYWSVFEKMAFKHKHL